jgi:hypothetical protein
VSRRFTAGHETGHAFFWFHAGASLADIRIQPSPSMGDGEWEGQVDPGDKSALDISQGIMAAYGGALAEAKLRLQDATHRRVRFDYANDERAFVDGRVTDPAAGMTSIAFVDFDTGQPLAQSLLTASFHSDVQGTPDEPGAFQLANAVGRPDVLVPLCHQVRRLLDLPAIWHTVLRFLSHLEQENHIRAPHCRNLLNHIFEQETALAARELWIERGSPLWDDQRDWFVAQGDA